MRPPPSRSGGASAGGADPADPADPAPAAGDPEALPEAFVEGLRLFDEGDFWECHEALEPLWLEASGEAEAFYQGLIQAAAALDHLTRTGRLDGARHLLAAALAKLGPLGDRREGVDLAALRGHLVRLAEALAAQAGGRRGPLGPDELAPPRLGPP